MKVLVLNGPNLNLLGTRDPDIYGTETLSDLERMVTAWGSGMGLDVETYQTNHEGELIDQIHRTDLDGIVINPAAYTHTSRAIPEAIEAVPIPVVEVHLSNIKEREPWRALSLVSDVCSASIHGRGLIGYQHALRHLVNQAALPLQTLRYGPETDQVGDLRIGGNTLAILVHGGFWRHEWTRDTMESLAVDLTQGGISTWNIEYRRLGAGGGWPVTPEDVLLALDHVSELGMKPSRVVVVGHSAGGNMAMWAAWRSATNIDQIVALAPVVDLERHARSQMYGAEEAQFLLDSGAPRRISAGEVPTLLVHGEADHHVPIAHSADLAREEGLELLTTSTGHFELLDPEREDWDKIRSVIAG